MLIVNSPEDPKVWPSFYNPLHTLPPRGRRPVAALVRARGPAAGERDDPRAESARAEGYACFSRALAARTG